MKRPVWPIALGFILCLLGLLAIALLLKQQNEAIERGDLLVLYHEGHRFGPIFVDKVAHRVVDKTDVFSRITWEDDNGKVWTQYNLVCYQAYLTGNIPATADEETLFRRYFPPWNRV